MATMNSQQMKDCAVGAHTQTQLPKEKDVSTPTTSDDGSSRSSVPKEKSSSSSLTAQKKKETATVFAPSRLAKCFASLRLIVPQPPLIDRLAKNNSSLLSEIGPVRSLRKDGDCRIAHYKLGKRLGKGSFGQVLKGTDTRSNRPVAVKVLKKHTLQTLTDVAQVNREVAVLRHHGHHPNIIGFRDVLHTHKRIYIVLERANMSLFELARTDIPKKQPDLWLQVMLGILTPFKYLHERGVRHGDLHLGNVMIVTDKDGRVEAKDIRLIDFGFAQMSGCYSSTNTDLDSNLLTEDQAAIFTRKGCGKGDGHVHYRAPEMNRCCCACSHCSPFYEGRPTDIWAIGVALMTVAYGRNIALLGAAMNKDKSAYAESLERFQHMRRAHKGDRLMHDLLFNGLLEMDPEKRATAKEALQHPWFNYLYPATK